MHLYNSQRHGWEEGTYISRERVQANSFSVLNNFKGLCYLNNFLTLKKWTINWKAKILVKIKSSSKGERAQEITEEKCKESPRLKSLDKFPKLSKLRCKRSQGQGCKKIM